MRDVGFGTPGAPFAPVPQCISFEQALGGFLAVSTRAASGAPPADDPFCGVFWVRVTPERVMTARHTTPLDE
jgi:hypothetical protein